MAIDVSDFKGEAPRIAPRLLPNDMAQNSANARLLSGNLDIWYGFTAASNQIIANAPVTIYYLDDQVWLSWSQSQLTPGAVEVDVAKAAIGGDISFRTYFCGTDAPRFTDIGLSSGLTSGGNPVTGSATLGPASGPYPTYSRKIGVPNPTLAITNPTLPPAAPGSNAVTFTETFDSPALWNLQPNGSQTATGFQTTGGNPGACLNCVSLGYESYGWKSFGVDPTLPVTMDADFRFQRIGQGHENNNYVDFFVGLDSSMDGTVVRLQCGTSSMNVLFCSVTAGVIGNILSSTTIPAANISTFHTDSDTTWNGPFLGNVYYHAKISVTPGSPTTSASVNIMLLNALGGTSILTGIYSGGVTYGACPNAGGGFGCGTFTPPNGTPAPYYSLMNFDNVTIVGSGVFNSQSSEATSYLYTLVNDLGEESGPCPAMVTADGTGVVTRLAGQAVLITLPATLAAAGIDQTYFYGGTSYIPPVQTGTSVPSPSMNLYRAVTGSTGTSFLLVAENIAFGENLSFASNGTPISTLGNPTTTVLDTLVDAALTFTLDSILWYPPPTGMLGVLPLPNGIYAGFVGNQLCLSAQGIPHAWPLIYQLTFDFPIVGIGAIDSTVVVCTENFPYLCAGNTPDNYSQTKASYPYACASKRSIQSIQNIGVVFASFEGLVGISSPGQERVLTKDLFTKREWLALNPPSMISAVNDNRYFCWYTTLAGVKGGFYLDLQPQSPYPGIPSIIAGKVSLAFHAYARYNDPLSDILYLVLDTGLPNPPSNTYDPNKTGPNIALSSSNSVATWTSGNGGESTPTTLSVSGVSTGKYYWEVSLSSSSGNAWSQALGFIGIANASANLFNNVGSDTNGYAMNVFGQKVYNNLATSYATGVTFANGSVIGIYFDATDGTLGFTFNGVDKGIAFTGIPSNTWYGAAAATGYFLDCIVTENFNGPMVYTPPNGYTAGLP